MFNQCSFILGEDESIIIAVPGSVPKDMPLCVEVGQDSVSFFMGQQHVGQVHMPHEKVLKRLASKQKVGLIEVIDGKPNFPAYIALVADIRMSDIAA